MFRRPRGLFIPSNAALRGTSREQYWTPPFVRDARAFLARRALCVIQSASVTPPTGREVIVMTTRAIAKGLSLGAAGMFARRGKKLITSIAIALAASLAFIPNSASADDDQMSAQKSSAKPAYTSGTLADEAPHITPVIEGTVPGQPTSPPSILSTYSQGTLADEAPHITPIIEAAPEQAQPTSQAMAPPAGTQGTLADEAPHITPIAPGARGTDTTQVPQE